MTVAERTREAVRERPFLYDALRAGVLNYTATARYLDVGEEEAVAAALRRFADELDDPPKGGAGRVTMESGLGRTEGDGLVVVGETAFTPGAGSLTGVVATGDVSPLDLGRVLGRCETAGVSVEAAGVADGHLVVVVERRDGPDVVRLVEDCL